MFSHIYIEEEISTHPRARDICARFPRAQLVPCEHYGAVFNPRSQNFRLQKHRPALILAKKHSKLLLEAPRGYGIGGEKNYYFSHLLNCLYDCRYCFLQGMYRSAHYVLFVNYEDFCMEIDAIQQAHQDNPTWFFSGYDCDSMALEPVSGFAAHFLPYFSARPDVFLELRTKSTQIRALLNRDPLANTVVAFSFTPGETHRALEHKVPGIERRLAAMARLQQSGWKLGLRFDPLIYQQNFRQQYSGLFAQLFNRLDVEQLHSVSLGPFRLPRDYFRNILQLYPDEPLYAGPLAETDGTVSYRNDLEHEITGFCTQELLNYIPESRLFSCPATA